MKILLFRSSYMAHMFTILDRLECDYPKAVVDICCHEDKIALLQHRAQVRHCYAFPPSCHFTMALFSGALRKDLRQESYDRVVIPCPNAAGEGCWNIVSIARRLGVKDYVCYLVNGETCRPQATLYRKELLSLMTAAFWKILYKGTDAVFRRRSVKKRRFLCVSFGKIGDMTVTFPLVRCVKEQNSCTSVGLLTDDAYPEYLDMFRELLGNRLFVLRKQAGFFEKVRLMCRVWQQGFDVAVMPYLDIGPILSGFLLGIPSRIGMRTKFWQGPFDYVFTERCSTNQPIQDFLHFAALPFKQSGVDMTSMSPRINLPVANQDYVEKLLASHHVPQSDMLIGISPVCHWRARRWAEKNFSQLCDAMIQRYNAYCILIGRMDEDDIIEAIVQGMRFRNAALNLCGKLRLFDVAALFEHCELVVGNDSGPMHIAAAVGTPTVSIIGPAPLFARPSGPGHESVFVPMACRPCQQYEFAKGCMRGDIACVNGIDVDRVFSAVERQLLKTDQRGQ